MARKEKLIVAGAIAAHPIGGGGNAWAFLQYVLGFRALGFDVAYFEEIAPERCIDAAWRPCAFAASANLAFLHAVAERFGFADRFLLSCRDGSGTSAGMSRRQAERFAAQASLLVNLSGRFHDEEILGRVARRMYLDLDPGFTQIWQERYGVNMNLARHDVYCTVGLNLSAPDCPVPRCQRPWHPTVPPVVLEHWPVAEIPGTAWTTVADWRGYSPVEWQGQWYGQKSEEFLKVLDLPRKVPATLELCLAIHPAEPDLARLIAHGWKLTSPEEHCADPDAYRRYVRSSRGEFSVAKNGYVVGRTGWFSDRSACYLAAGLPVVVQDTGISPHLPVGRGLLTFRTEDEAAEALHEVERDYASHRRAARALAEEVFASHVVLPRLLALAGL